jgi:hypothetical protein
MCQTYCAISCVSILSVNDKWLVKKKKKAMQRTRQTNEHAKQMNMPNKRTCQTNEHAKQTNVPNKRACQTNEHAKQTSMPNN